MTYSLAYVTATEDLNRRLRRIHFEVPDLARLGLPGQPDEALGMYFPPVGTRCAPAMELRDGIWGYHDLDPAPEGRNYSVRAVDHAAATMVVDFVIHAHGPATTWAQRAEVGDAIACSHARGWYRPPADTDWTLLVFDLAGLPAAARIVAELDATIAGRVTAIAEVADVEDLDHFTTAPGIEVIPLTGSGNGLAPSRLGESVANWSMPSGTGYCWFGGEAAQSRAVRSHFRRGHKWHHTQYDIIGYWRHNGEEWSRRYAQHGDEFLAVYQQAIADGKGEKRAGEEFDEALEKAGL